MEVIFVGSSLYHCFVHSHMIVPEGFWEIIGQSRQRVHTADECALVHPAFYSSTHYHYICYDAKTNKQNNSLPPVICCHMSID